MAPFVQLLENEVEKKVEHLGGNDQHDQHSSPHQPQEQPLPAQDIQISDNVYQNSNHSTAADDEQRRLWMESENLKHVRQNGIIIKPDPTTGNTIWRVGKEINGAIKWLSESGDYNWAKTEAAKRTVTPAPQPTITVIQIKEDPKYLTDKEVEIFWSDL